MVRGKDWSDDDERTTSPGGKRGGSRTNTDHTVGQLMVESINQRRRIEVLEERVSDLETAQKNLSLAPGSSIAPTKGQRILSLVRKTVTYTVVIIAGIISALKELGFLGVH